MVLRPIIKGFMGELQSKVTQWLFLDSNIYKNFNNLIINDEKGSTQIDHIIVSKYGIFVIETKNYSGWIFGNEKSNKWTQNLYGNKKQFQNPLHQNYRHTKALAKYLNVSDEKVKPVVIFWGDCEFKTSMPKHVIRGGITGNTNYIKEFKEVIFTNEEIEKICTKIKTGKDEMGFLSGLRHAKSVNER